MNQINVVPYIDVMLVLLVIFMVTAPLVNPGQIELPQVGKTTSPPCSDGSLHHSDKSLSLRDRARDSKDLKLDRTELLKAIKEKQVRNADQAVVISATRTSDMKPSST